MQATIAGESFSNLRRNSTLLMGHPPPGANERPPASCTPWTQHKCSIRFYNEVRKAGDPRSVRPSVKAEPNSDRRNASSRRQLSGMCEKCLETDRRIERLKSIAARLTDQQTVEGAAVLVVELEAKKAALHPPDGKPQA
jgi:hypothetical protein